MPSLQAAIDPLVVDSSELEDREAEKHHARGDLQIPEETTKASCDTSNAHSTASLPTNLYPDITTANHPDLNQFASSHLINFGTTFLPDLIISASHLSLFTAPAPGSSAPYGRAITDWTSGQMSSLIGHSHPEIVSVIQSHASSLDHLFSGMLSPPVVNLAKRLTSVLPEGLDRAMFLSTGGESNEAAIKMAKTFTGKFEVVGLGASWHGVTAQASSVQYHAGRKVGWPMIPGGLMLPSPNAYRCHEGFRKRKEKVVHGEDEWEYDWEAEMLYGWRLIDQQSCGSLAAVIVEPIQSSGGMHVLPAGYLRRLKLECEKRGMLLIVDEAQTGIGRTGEMVAVNHDGVVPDILTLSKTLGNGLPLSAVVTSHAIADVCAERDFLFYTTHVNDPLPCAVGDKVLEIVVRDDLVSHARRMGDILHSGLEQLKGRYACIGDVRGRGLMAGVEIVEDRRRGKEPATELAKRIGDRAYELGLWCNLSTHPSFGGTFRIAPPITISEQEVRDGLSVLEEAFKGVEGTLALD
ncbi:2,2-dialkylglycine decarboxylase [Sordaria brevicollis]|uniref:2,2-dialkylglycine decarboxylase n=1 Tax=Sordaria brevicollis TaxID=83679 RepID=A0AAE0PGP7_SORBR|nr:2,2-dialkylglycine decarboxylase [Sordaria brevicollis]